MELFFIHSGGEDRFCCTEIYWFVGPKVSIIVELNVHAYLRHWCQYQDKHFHWRLRICSQRFGLAYQDTETVSSGRTFLSSEGIPETKELVPSTDQD